MPRWLRNTLVLVALWLSFEATISWLATCDPPHKGATAYGSNQGHCTAFSGPVFSLLYFFAVQTTHFLKEYEHELIAGFTIVLAASTIGLWISTNKLWEAGERQIRLSRSVAAVQTRNNRRQLKHAEETAERQLRAYVVAIKARIRGVEVGQIPKAVISLRNAGQTPAYDLMANFGMGVNVYPVPKDLPPLPQPEAYSRATIGPGQTIKHEAKLSVPLEDKHVTAIREGTGAIVVMGDIQYRDAFGHQRTVSVRLMYTHRVLGKKTMEICPDGNKTS